MPTCCGASCCDKFEDGILSGKDSPLSDNFLKPLSVVFQDQLKHIDGSKTAIDFNNAFLTYMQLDDFSNSLAYDIADRVGLNFTITNPDSDILIATCLRGSEKSISVILGILKTGAGYLPIDPEYPEQLILDILSTFKPVFLIADENGHIYNKYDVPKFNEICKLITIEELWLDMDIPRTDQERRLSLEQRPLDCFEIFQANPPDKRVAAVFHTRGIHGNPVGIRLSNMSIINRVLFDWKQMQLKPTESCSLTLPVSSPDSVSQIFSPLLKGCTLHIFRRQDLRDMENFVTAIATKGINRLTIANHYFREFLQTVEIISQTEGAKAFKNLRIVGVRGGFMAYSDVQRFFDVLKNATLFNCNGPAETLGEVIHEKFHSVKEFSSNRVLGRLTLGRVIDNVKIYIVGSNLGIISDGNQGEICVSGMALAMGYVNEKNLMEPQKGAFVKNPHKDCHGHETLFRSGEYGRILVSKDGKRHLYFEGRDDNIVKRNGHDFAMEDLRLFLLELDPVEDAYVFVYHKGKVTQEIIGFIVLKDKSTPVDLGELEFTLRNKVPEWAMPDEIMVIDEVPKHQYGEMCPYCLMLQFHELREPKHVDYDLLGYPPEKLDAAKILIKGMFKFCLIPVEITIRNMEKTFFELGVNSLNAVTLLVYLNRHGYHVSLRDFLSTPKISDFVGLTELRHTSKFSQHSMATLNGPCKANFHIMVELADEYHVEPMRKNHKIHAINIIANAYCEKGELQAYNMVSVDDFVSFLSTTWSAYEDDGASLVVRRRSDGLLVAAALCDDFFTIIDVARANGSLFHVLEFYHEIKGNMLQFVPHRKGDTLEISWMGTHTSLTPQENIKLITMLHNELIKDAKRNEYCMIFNPTTNKLSRTLSIDVFGYDLKEDFQANKYKELDGSRPFHLAPDMITAGGLLLKLREPTQPSHTSTATAVNPTKYLEQLSPKGPGQMTSFHEVSVEPTITNPQ